MGHIKSILSERQIGKERLYPSHARLEISECVHFHYRDLRFVMSSQEMEVWGKIFKEGLKKWEEMGQPEQGDNPYKGFTVLCEEHLPDEGYHANRLAIEEEEDGSIHTHYGALRTHLKPVDFLILAQQMWLAYLQYNKQHKTLISLGDLTYHPVVDDYVRILSNCEEDSHDKTSTIDFMLANKWCRSNDIGTKRPNGLPEEFPGKIPEGRDVEYLFSLCRSIKEHGYASGPYKYQLVRVYIQKDGSLYAKDSHRLACLLHLNYEEVNVLVVNEESGWRE